MAGRCWEMFMRRLYEWWDIRDYVSCWLCREVWFLIHCSLLLG